MNRTALLAALCAILVAGCSANGGGTGASVTVGPPPSAATPTPAPLPTAAAQLPTLTMTLEPAQVNAGESAALTWTSAHAERCSASGVWSGAQSTNGTRVSTGAMAHSGTYVWALTCTGPGGSTSATRTLLVGRVPTPVIEFALSPPTARPGDTVRLSWSTSGAAQCAGSGGFGGDGWSGTRSLSAPAFDVGPLPAGEHDYTLTCTGPGGTSSETRLLTVTQAAPPAPPQLTFAAQPTQIVPGGSSTFQWSAANVTSCTATGGAAGDQWAGNQPLNSTGLAVGPLATEGQFGYQLSCAGPGGSISRSVTLLVAATPVPNATTVQIGASPTTVGAGGGATLDWTSTGTDSCTASGSWSGPRATSGSAVNTGSLSQVGTYSFTLTCSGPTGTATQTATVNVTPARPGVTIFQASPTTVAYGGGTQLSWNTSDATSCTASGGTPGDGWGGAVPVNGAAVSVGPLTAAGTATYTLVCQGPGGTSDPGTVQVTVLPQPAPASVVSLVLHPNAISAGQSATVSWDSQNATSCAASGGTGSDGWAGVRPPTGSLSVGPINATGVHTYTLTCSGPGGTGAPASASLSVGTATPPASVAQLVANPTTVTAGSGSTLTWSTADATSCTASGGIGTDGWSGAVPTSGTAQPIGPFVTAGTVTYVLTCSGPGGTSGPQSVDVTVNPAPPPASIVTFDAAPAAVFTGQSTTLSWSTTHAASCTASGGTGADGWSGPVGTASAGRSVGPFASAGTVQYTLNCPGLAGAPATRTVDVHVTIPPPGAPTVTISANDLNPASIPPGQAFNLKWSSTNATSCTASGGTGTDGWAGVRPTNSAGTSMGPVATPGVYTYSINCSGAGGSASASVKVTVISSPAADCGIGEPSTALLSPAATVSTWVSGVCVAGCGIASPGNVIDSNPNNRATMSVGVGVLAYSALRVTDTTATYPAGRKAGFLISDPDVVLSLGLLGNFTVHTLLNGTIQESRTGGGLLELTAVGLFADPHQGYVGFRTSKPFNAVRFDLGSLASVADQKRIYGACVTLQ